jgi:hypothetical protein
VSENITWRSVRSAGGRQSPAGWTVVRSSPLAGPVAHSAHRSLAASRCAFGVAASVAILGTTIGNPGIGFLLLVIAELIILPSRGNATDLRESRLPALRRNGMELIVRRAPTMSGAGGSTT